MKDKIKNNIWLLCMIAFFGSNLFGQKATDFNQFSQLKLEVSTPKKNYFPLEPIPLTFNILNETDKPIKGRLRIDFASYLNMEFAYKGKKQVHPLSFLRKLLIVAPQTLAPGEMTGPQRKIILDKLEAFFAPGDYELIFNQGDDSSQQSITSNTVKIKIEQPEGMNREAIEFIKKKTDFSKKSNPLIEGVGWERNDLKIFLEEFVSKFGRTDYADYAFLQLGKIYLYSDKDYVKAETEFNKVRYKENFPLAHEAAYYLSEIERKRRSEN